MLPNATARYVERCFLFISTVNIVFQRCQVPQGDMLIGVHINSKEGDVVSHKVNQSVSHKIS